MAGLPRGRRVEEWVVLHGGAVAAYDVGSLAEATALASEIADVPGWLVRVPC